MVLKATPWAILEKSSSLKKSANELLSSYCSFFLIYKRAWNINQVYQLPWQCKEHGSLQVLLWRTLDMRHISTLFLSFCKFHFSHQVLLGRDSEVAQVQGYIDGDSDRPLVMIGFPGSGKSSMAAFMVKKCLQNNKFKVKLWWQEEKLCIYETKKSFVQKEAKIHFFYMNEFILWSLIMFNFDLTELCPIDETF